MHRTICGIEVTDENLGFESIQAAVAGSGHFIDAPETMVSMEHWQRAKVKVERLLWQHPSYLDSEIDLEIRQQHPILLK